jgi:hypothetical protein
VRAAAALRADWSARETARASAHPVVPESIVVVLNALRPLKTSQN